MEKEMYIEEQVARAISGTDSLEIEDGELVYYLHLDDDLNPKYADHQYEDLQITEVLGPVEYFTDEHGNLSVNESFADTDFKRVCYELADTLIDMREEREKEKFNERDAKAVLRYMTLERAVDILTEDKDELWCRYGKWTHEVLDLALEVAYSHVVERWDTWDPKYPNNTYYTGVTLDNRQRFRTTYSGCCGWHYDSQWVRA